MQTNRAKNEIEHGKFLNSVDTELTWGWGSFAGQYRARRRSQMLAETTDLKSGKKSLEIGCGTGMFTETFASTGAEIIAVDISSPLLEKAKNRINWGDNVQFIEKNFEDCEVNGPFDIILGSSILHHLEVERSLSKIFNMLKPGGVVAFAEPNMLNPQICLQKNIPWLKRLMGDSPDETAFIRWKLASLLSELGFINIQITPFDWLHPSTPKALTPAVSILGRIFEKIPIVKEFSGSLLIRANRPQLLTS